MRAGSLHAVALRRERRFSSASEAEKAVQNLDGLDIAGMRIKARSGFFRPVRKLSLQISCTAHPSRKPDLGCFLAGTVALSTCALRSWQMEVDIHF